MCRYSSTMGKSFTRSCLYNVKWHPAWLPCGWILTPVITCYHPFILVNILWCVRLYIKWKYCYYCQLLLFWSLPGGCVCKLLIAIKPVALDALFGSGCCCWFAAVCRCAGDTCGCCTCWGSITLQSALKYPDWSWVIMTPADVCKCCTWGGCEDGDSWLPVQQKHLHGGPVPPNQSLRLVGFIGRRINNGQQCLILWRVTHSDKHNWQRQKYITKFLTNCGYNLHTRPHNFALPVKDDTNFVSRSLYAELKS